MLQQQTQHLQYVINLKLRDIKQIIAELVDESFFILDVW